MPTESKWGMSLVGWSALNLRIQTEKEKAQLEISWS